MDPRDHPVAWGLAPVALMAVGSLPVVVPVVALTLDHQAGRGQEAAVAVAVAGSVDRQGRQPGTPQRAPTYRHCCSRRSRSRS